MRNQLRDQALASKVFDQTGHAAERDIECRVRKVGQDPARPLQGKQANMRSRRLQESLVRPDAGKDEQNVRPEALDLSEQDIPPAYVHEIAFNQFGQSVIARPGLLQRK
jgi:hypothetical protein